MAEIKVSKTNFQPISQTGCKSTSITIFSKLVSLIGQGEMAFMLWCVWQWRNKAIYQRQVDLVDSIYPLVQRLTSEYYLANEVDVPRAVPIPIIWRPSTVCEFKVNFDAAVFPKHHSTEVGVVIRNGQGLPIAVACQWYPCVYAIDNAEAMAARVAL